MFSLRLMRSAPMVGALRSLTPVAIAAFVLLGVLPRTGLYRPATALSGSMAPMFSPGDLLILRPESLTQLKVGQVITYSIPIGDHHLETHRVVRILHHGEHPVVVTRGDANPTADPWTAMLTGGPVWQVDRVIPYAGLALLWLAQPWVKIAFVLGTLCFVMLVGLIRIWAPARTPAPAPVTVTALASGRGGRDDAAVAA